MVGLLELKKLKESYPSLDLHEQLVVNTRIFKENLKMISIGMSWLISWTYLEQSNKIIQGGRKAEYNSGDQRHSKKNGKYSRGRRRVFFDK